jgi:hypothetical protein
MLFPMVNLGYMADKDSKRPLEGGIGYETAI